MASRLPLAASISETARVVVPRSMAMAYMLK
jgi:hypothetical protein